MNAKSMLSAFVVTLAAVSGVAALPQGVVVERARDSADRAEIIRWYDWSNCDPARIARKEYVQCEGALHYDVDIPETGWYELWQQGFEQLWTRNWLVDGRPVAESFLTARGETSAARDWAKWSKELNIFLEAGRHEICFRRTTFPGRFPTAWRLAAPGAAGRPAVRGMIRASLPQGVVRAGDEFEIAVECGGPAGGASSKPAADARLVATFVATCDHREDAPVSLGTVEFSAGGRPERRILRGRVPDEGVYTIRLLDESGLSWNGDCAAGTLVVVDTNTPPAAEALDMKCVVDIDCAATKPLAEVEGATRVVRIPAGAYRESSGSAPDEHWALDGFSYGIQLPDDRSTYLLAVDYPDDAFRSVGFWLNDGAKGNTEGRVLTGGVETGGQYSLSGGMLRHEAFFWPRGTNCVFAAVNLNRGSRAAASRIRVYRVAGPLPAVPAGIRRGRLAGAFFEENGRWKRHFGMEHDSEAIHSQVFENLKSMERWGEWNRFVGENLMCPSLVAYGGVQYPSRVISGTCIQPVNEARMLAFVAEKYGCRLMPHITLHGDSVFDARMGISVEKSVRADGKTVETPRFADPDVVEWSRIGTTEIPWRTWSYNPLHPKVQEYMVAAIDEIAAMLADSPAFAGVSLRLPLSWQFSGITGLNHGDYGYGDFTMRLFESETGIKVPDGGGGEKRFAARFAFLDSPEMRPKWIAWRTKKMKDYYGRLLAAMRRYRPDAQLNIMFWPSGFPGVGRRIRTLAEQMEESGISPEAWKDVEGVSFCGMQFFQGRRYFTPRCAAKQYYRLFDKDILGMSASGPRAVCIYTDYYEVNTHLDWKKYGAEDGMAFDCCVPGGDSEMEAWSVPLAEIDPGIYANGGNGWMFGTPRLRSPWLREYLALPPGRFSPISGVKDGAVAFRAYAGAEGRFMYAVNVTDRPAKVRIKCDAGTRLLGAADDKPADGDFTLAPFALRSFKIEGSGAVCASAADDPVIRRRYADAVPFLKKLSAALRAGSCAAGMPQEFVEGVGKCVADASAAFAEGRWLDFRAAFYDPRIAYLCDIVGKCPPGWWEGGSGGGFGGCPPNTAKMPELALCGISGDARPPDPRRPVLHAFTEMPISFPDSRREQHPMKNAFKNQGIGTTRICSAADGTVFAVDPNAHRVSATGADGKLMWERLDNGTQSHRLGDVPLVAPAGCALDGEGRLWVTDEGADRILCFEAATGAYIGRFGHSGTRDDRSGKGFFRPRDIVVERNVLKVEDLGNQRTVELEIRKRK